VIYGQTVYARTLDPGYDRSHILQIDELSRYQLLDKGETIADRMRRIPRCSRRPHDDRSRHR
jgi:putative ABC transport system permease protein